ncbi:MAG: hypothetical protein ACC662_00705, partial [Planctomycetota bacterium]
RAFSTAWSSPSAKATTAWRLPSPGAAIYEREQDDDVPSAFLSLLPVDPEPAVLLSSDLGVEGRRITRRIRDLPDVALRLALDLGASPEEPRVRFVLPDLRTVAPVTVLATYGAMDPEGRQHVDAILLCEPAAGAGAEAGAASRRPTIRGTVRIDRIYDRERGLVTSFESRIDIRVHRPAAAGSKGPPPPDGSFFLAEEWTLQEVLEPRGPAFRRRVDQAIQRSIEDLTWVLSLRGTPDSPLGRGPSGRRWQGAGRLALVLHALLAAEVDPAGEVVAGALEDLRGRDIRATYSLACALQAIEALYAPAGERERILRGELQQPPTRSLSPRDRALVETWTKRLLDNCDRRVDPGYVRRWRYVASNDYDNSNTQYALLGLRSAALCGVRIPAGVWRAAAQHWIDEAKTDEKTSIRLELTSQIHAPGKSGRPPTEGKTVARGPKVHPTGWGYRGRFAARGSMTAAGISSLAICREALEPVRRFRRGERRAIGGLIEGGFAWFAQYFTVWEVPGAPTRACTRYYYLYGLERACELNRVARIQGRDWYFEGAAWLIAKQGPAGSWGTSVDSAFALLFLKKAVRPVITPPR